MMFRVSDNIVHKEIDDKMVLIDLESGFYYSLNELGRFIFNLILEQKDISLIISEIESRYEISQTMAEQDLQMFINALEQENILCSDK